MHKLEINILDDGYFNCKNGVYSVSPVGQEMTDMIRALVSRIARGHGSAHTEHSYDCASERRPEAAPQGSRVLEFKHESLPTVRQIGRRRAPESHFKGGNLNTTCPPTMSHQQQCHPAQLTMSSEQSVQHRLLRQNSWLWCGAVGWHHGGGFSAQHCENARFICSTVAMTWACGRLVGGLQPQA